ncbi:MAG: hypothetical protein ACRD2N_08335 [Vicinamibacterales bacterium]
MADERVPSVIGRRVGAYDVVSLLGAGGMGEVTNRQQYAVAPDGQSFIMNAAPDSDNSAPVTIILNWKPKP